jgi:hypothetical protein
MTKFVPCPVALALALAFVQPAFAQQATDQPGPAPLGKLVDVGGRKLHLYCTGNGSPAVILEAGAGSFSIGGHLFSLRWPRLHAYARTIALAMAGATQVRSGTPSSKSRAILKQH